MKQQSPMLRLWELGEGQQGGLKRAVLSAVVGVLFGMLPYFAVAQIILGLLSGNQESSFYLTWCAVALVGFCSGPPCIPWLYPNPTRPPLLS